MKDIDTETTVVWPSWCYSDDICKQLLKPSTGIVKDSLVCDPEIVVLPTIIIDARHRHSTDTYDSSTGNHIDSRIRQNKSHTRLAIGDKMISERSLLLSGYNNTSIDNVKKNCEQTKTPPPPALSAAQAAALTVTPTTTAAAAAAYLYLEKVKNERMSPRVTAAQIDSLKDAIMESSAAAAAVAAAMVNNNNCSSSINNNNNNNSSNVNSCGSNHNNNLVLSQNQIDNSLNNTSDELQSHSLPSPAGPQQQHQQSSSMHLNSNHVKRERLSPTGTNGDLQSALSRSRSTTPSSFRGTSPQHSVHSSPSETVVPLHNLSTNLLNSIQQAASSSARHNSINFSSGALNNPTTGVPSDFSTRNYSDFMRSLAAKYNNTNPTDSSNSRRQVFFDATANNATKKTTSTTTKTSYRAHSPSSTSISKEVSITTTSSLAPPPPLSSGAISPSESALSHTQQSQMAAAAVASAAAANAASGGSVSPFMTSFLSSLPFAQGIFPPLIDMSSTQALITLARAAKETEMHNILQMTQNSKSSTTDVSSTSSPSLNVALQQAAQFISPALIYSAQVQKQQLVSRQSSPRSTNITNTSSSSANAALSKNVGDKRNASPLDLSSQPPASKRFKAESTSSQSSTDGLLDVTIKRRTSASTGTTSPSPPPLNDNSSSPVAPATEEATVTAAFTPLTVGGSTSTTSSAYGSISNRQCQAHSEEVNSWTVQDVCAFVGSIDICTEYVKHFRDQCIDGSGLPLLTEDHLVNSLGMKLGPALKLRSMLAKKLGGPCPCVACVAQTQQLLALQTGAVVTPASTGSSSVASNATSSAPENSGNCHSYRPNATATLCIAGAASTSNGGTNCGSNNNTNSTNKNDSTSMASANSSNVSVPANNGIENSGGSSVTAGNNNCNINVATFPPPTYSNCCSNNYSSSSKSSASNRDETGGSSSNSS